MRLIDADELIKKECCGRIFGNDVRNAPTVDAVEGVRCKDCKHYTPLPLQGLPKEKYWSGVCQKWATDIDNVPFTDGYNYCSYGERREP